MTQAEATAISIPARSTSNPSFADVCSICFGVLLPTIAKGVIIRRPAIMTIAEHLDLDRRAIHRMQILNEKYGSGPLHFRLFGRSLALVLDPNDVHVILDRSPNPFQVATLEKTAAISHLAPKNVLISRGEERAERRSFNEEALETNSPVHHLAERFEHIVLEEASRLREEISKELTWQAFSDAWMRIVRRVIFGDAAREDREITEIVAQLRSDANWAFLRPRRTHLRTQMLSRIESYLRRAGSGSLAGVIAHMHATDVAAPEQQIPQWLFAFDPAGMATFRTLALLASHPQAASRVRDELREQTDGSLHYLPFARACVLESLRLWPTTPLILREADEETQWSNGTIPAGASFIIFTPYFHRDARRLQFADHFSPDIWLLGAETRPPGLVPFSDGPAACPGRRLVLLLSTMMIGAVLRQWRVRLASPRLDAGNPLPATLNHFRIRFDLKS